MILKELAPFGLEVTSKQVGERIDSLATEQIQQWIGRHRLLVLRGFKVPSDDETVSFCNRFGEVFQWDFGAINELRVNANSPNYLYTNRAVPFHWDGAFTNRVPYLIFFHCVAAPPESSGGETLFCDTTRLPDLLTESERTAFRRVKITYSTEKIVHYGGQFTSPLFAEHPITGEVVIRFAEPVDDLNPVRLRIEGVAEESHAALIDRMQTLLRSPGTCLAHTWREGDCVLADNHALLHGRKAFENVSPRHLRRINIV